MKTQLSLFLALAAGAVLTTNAAPAATPGNPAPKAAVPAGPMGSVTWKGIAPQQSMLYVQKAGKAMMAPFGKDGTLKLPVGDYSVIYANYVVDGCSVAVRYDPKAFPKITVAEGKTTEIEPVAAATAKVTAGKPGPTGEINFDLAVATADGLKLTCQNIKDPKAKPSFRILDAAGKEVAKGSFEFG
jgi:hypothetical protein